MIDLTKSTHRHQESLMIDIIGSVAKLKAWEGLLSGWVEDGTGNIPLLKKKMELERSYRRYLNVDLKITKGAFK